MPIPTLNYRFVGFRVRQDLHRQDLPPLTSATRFDFWPISGMELLPRGERDARVWITPSFPLSPVYLSSPLFPSRGSLVETSSVNSHAFIQSRCIIRTSTRMNTVRARISRVIRINLCSINIGESPSGARKSRDSYVISGGNRGTV